MLGCKHYRTLEFVLGMQLAVIEMARNILGIKDANSVNFLNCSNSIVGLMTEVAMQQNKDEKRSENSDLGGTMRLGAYTRQN